MPASDTARLEDAEGLRLLAESAPVMLWMGDSEGRSVYLNAAQRAFWGLGEDEVAGFDWHATVHPDDAEAVSGPWQAALAAHEALTVELRLRRADGAYRDVLTSARPRFGPDGAFLGMIGVNVDVTEPRRSEAALRAESERLATLNRTGAALAAELDVARIVQLVGDACVQLIGAELGTFFYNLGDEDGEGVTHHALSGLPRQAPIFEPDFGGKGIVRSDDVLADPRYRQRKPALGMPPGHLPVRSYLAVPVISRSGEVIGALFFGHTEAGVFTAQHEEIIAGIAGQAAVALDNARLLQACERELAERRRAEAALQALNETLEARVADAIAERLLAEEALRRSQKMEAIGQLTGGVAHDFNNLLQVISGNLQLLARDCADSDRAQARIADALAGVAQGSKLASQLLAFSRRQPLAPKAVDAGRLVSGMSELLARTIGDGIEVETIVQGGLWNSLVDPGQLEAALLNLALNARDAMGGVGKLTIEAGNAVLDGAEALADDVRPGEYVALTVRDTGAGIPRDIIDRVFDPFFSTKPQGTGTGLGLSMVYGFVKQSGGHVAIVSEPGQGTTVRLYLPRTELAEELPDASDAGRVVGGSETILVAEDDDRVRATVVELLADLGYRVLTARDATSALGMLESGVAVDLLFTDVMMPGKLRSAELARLARERQPGIAVLFTSGYTEDSIVHDGRLDAGIELLSKPYSREALARKLRQVLARSAPRAEPGPLAVLLCEDDALIRMHTADLLQEAGLAVVEAGSGAQALAAIESGAPDVLVVDVGLPDMSGVELARRVRGRLPDLPVVFATGHAQVDGIEAMPRVEVVGKPYGADELCASIARLTSGTPADPSG